MTKPAIISHLAATSLDRWPDYPESEISSGARGSSGKFLFQDDDSGLMVGVWEAEANIGRWVDWPFHEFMIILEGEVVMIEEGRETVIGPGESFFIPRGRRCIWNQAGYVRKIMVLFSGGGVSPDRPIIKVDPNTALQPSQAPPATLLLSPPPVQHAHEFFEDATGQFTVGVWQTTGYHRKLINFPRHELMHLLEGSVTMIDDQGHEQVFHKGDTFFVPLGTPNSWRSEGTLKKIYCILQPK